MNIRFGHALTMKMAILGTISILGVALSLGGWARPAMADPTEGPPICSSAGTPLSGVHRGLTIHGNAYVASGTTLFVNGDLTIASGACLDAFTLGRVIVTGNVLVGLGATLALGCTPQSIGPVPPCNTTTTNDIVGGNIIAYKALTMYLDGDHIFGSVISRGGGDPTLTNPALSFPIKDNHIGGNLIIDHWQGAWFGALRNFVGGNVFLSRNVGTRLSPGGDPDSTEVASNNIVGNLVCLHNTPPAQIGDAGEEGAGPNRVAGRKVAECANLGPPHP